MVVEARDIDLVGDKILIEFWLSPWEEARKIFDHIDIESEEWQNIFEAILKAFGTKMKEEADEDEAK
jgi:hypothetical protein